MEISVLKRKSKPMRSFDKTEWKYYDREHFGRVISWDTRIYYLKAYEGKEIVGTMELKVEAGVGFIKTLIVKYSNQRKGTGKILMLEAENIIKKQNGHKIFLTTGKYWDAVKFYLALGFKQTGEMRNHYFHVNFIEMSKFI